MSKTASSDEMPDRYAPDPWMDNQAAPRPNENGPAIQVPRTVLNTWIEASPGDTFGFAPRGPRSVWFGKTVPRFLAESTVTRPPSQEKLRLWVRKPVVYYLDVSAGDPVRFHKPNRRGYLLLEVLDESEVDQ